MTRAQPGRAGASRWPLAGVRVAPLIPAGWWPAGSLAPAVRYPVAAVSSPVRHICLQIRPAAAGRASLLQSEGPEEIAPSRPVVSRLEEFVEPPARLGEQVPCLVEKW